MEDNGLVQEEVGIQLVTGQIYGNTIQVTDGANIEISLDPSQHNYSAPIPMEQVVIQSGVVPNGIIIQNVRGGVTQQDTDDPDSDTDVNDKVMASSMLNYTCKSEQGEDEDLIPDRLNLSISHHDYTGSVPIVQNHGKLSIGQVYENSGVLVNAVSECEGGGLVIEEAVEQEISTSTSLEDEEIVRSKPLTAMYLQRKDIGPMSLVDAVYIPNNLKDKKVTTPTKSPGSSKFTLKPSTRTLGLEYDDLRLYGEPISVYHPNTGEIHFKMPTDSDSEVRSPAAKRSVEAILAASETIKNQDIASEVEIGTYEVEVSPTGKRGRKRKEKKWGIDDDIEQIRKAAKNVAYTLKGMNKKGDGRKRKKPRIRLTLTKSKNRQPTSSSLSSEEDAEYTEPGTSVPKKRGRKRKDEPAETPSIIYQCEYCDKQFKTREKVRAHTKIHTEEREFGCDICGSRYRRREHLIRHYRRHTNDRPYVCLECGKSYMRAEHLKRHSYDHSGEKPFECPVCPKAFTRHDRLIKHSLVHDK